MKYLEHSDPFTRISNFITMNNLERLSHDTIERVINTLTAVNSDRYPIPCGFDWDEVTVAYNNVVDEVLLVNNYGDLLVYLEDVGLVYYVLVDGYGDNIINFAQQVVEENLQLYLTIFEKERIKSYCDETIILLNKEDDKKVIDYLKRALELI